MKLRVLAACLVALSLTAGVASAQTAPAAAPAAAKPAAGPNPFLAAQAGIDKQTLSYAYGYDFGVQMVNRGADLDLATLIRALQDAYAKRALPANMPAEKLQQAMTKHQTQFAAILKAQFDKVSKENKTRSDAFLAANKTKPGIVTLPSGIQYRIIEAGSGAKPTANSTVDIQFSSVLAVNNQPLINTYSSPKPQTGKVSELPWTGLRKAIVLMPAGSRWEIYLPSVEAYGNSPNSPIGPEQAVKFEVSLIAVK